MKLRYGYVDPQPQKRLTPKSAFLRKLERMQRVPIQNVPVKIIDEVFTEPTSKPLAELFPWVKAPHLTLVRK